MKFDFNYNQIYRNIANILSDNRNAKKMDQFLTVCDICEYLTSDNGIDVTAEMYNDNIVRYLITGTRCGMTITANALTNEIVRKKRNEKPFETRSFQCRCEDILEFANVPEKYKVVCYDKHGNKCKEVETDTLKEAEKIRTEHGLSIGLEPEPTYKDFAKYPTIWVFHEITYADGTTENGYERLLGY